MKAVVEAKVAEEVETAKSGRLDREEVAETESMAKGVVVPMPRAPRKLEAVVEVEVREPVESWPVERVEKIEETERKMLVKRVVEVALVAVALTTVRFWKEETTVVEVAVMLPTVRLPIDEEAAEKMEVVALYEKRFGKMFKAVVLVEK